jgi:hypothetical protein
LKVEQILKILARRSFRGSDVRIGSIVCVLGHQRGDSQHRDKRDPHIPPRRYPGEAGVKLRAEARPYIIRCKLPAQVCV